MYLCSGVFLSRFESVLNQSEDGWPRKFQIIYCLPLRKYDAPFMSQVPITITLLRGEKEEKRTRDETKMRAVLFWGVILLLQKKIG